MTDIIKCFRKVKCEDNNIWVSFKEVGCGFENLNKCSGSGGGRLESKLVAEG